MRISGIGGDMNFEGEGGGWLRTLTAQHGGHVSG